MNRLRRLIPLIPLAGVLALWAASYVRNPVALAGGYGAVAHRGAFVGGGPNAEAPDVYTVRLDPMDHRQRIEQTFGYFHEPWKPIRQLVLTGGHLWLVEAWLVALVAAVPTAWAVRRQRRRRAKSPQGFDVLPRAGGGAA
jgi:hypothetical protein